MNQTAISAITARQRRFFDTGVTLDIRYRIAALRRLQGVVMEHEAELSAALRQDLGKSDVESYLCEIGVLRARLRRLLRELRRQARQKTPGTVPQGVALILSPWSAPVLLTLGPLAEALAAGNTAVLKPSSNAPATARLLTRLLGSIFPSALVEVLSGSRETNAWLSEVRFDCVFFIGSQAAGRQIAQQAARHLTPAVLELGGKSPCIIHASADLASAARKVVFGKFLNCGQSCTAPDYVLCDARVQEEFLRRLRLEIHRQYGKEYKYNLSYGRIVSKKHFDRLLSLIDRDQVFLGGAADREALRIEPTVLTNVSWEDPVMDGEILGPLLPVLTFQNDQDAIRTIRSQPGAPALYVFARDRGFLRQLTACGHFGTCGINELPAHPDIDRPRIRPADRSPFTRCLRMVRFHPLELAVRYQPYPKLAKKLLRLILH